MNRLIDRICPYRIYLLALLFCSVLMPIAGCANDANFQLPDTATPQVGSEIEITPIPTSELSTKIPSPTIPAVNYSQSIIPTITSPPLMYENVFVQGIDPLAGNQLRIFGPGFWNSEYKFTFAYSSQGKEKAWSSFNIATNTEALALAPTQYNQDFWPDRKLWQVTEEQEVVGFYSPSGTYVLYPLWQETSNGPPARTDIWLANTTDGQSLKLQTFGSLNLSVTHASWSLDESKLYFSVAYEGLDEIFVADVASGETIPISSITDFDGISSEIWSISPDEQNMAVIDRDQHLRIVPLNGNESQMVDSGQALLPSWSANGQNLYYWWGNSQADPRKMSELRKFDRMTGITTTLVNATSLSQGLEKLNETQQTHHLFEAGSPYAVSPEEKNLLIWGDTLFWVALNPK